jgi:predicted XRE-type DNA-binding protein
MKSGNQTSEFLEALAAIEQAAKDNSVRAQAIQTRVRWVRARIAKGQSLVTVVESEPRPRVVELITTNIETLQSIGVQLRRAEARALRAEGLTMEAIAGLFGVTRQRISALLK